MHVHSLYTLCFVILENHALWLVGQGGTLIIPACRHFGLGLIPWSPLAGGLLGGVLKKMASGRRARPAFARLIEQYRPQLEAYEGLCEDLGEIFAVSKKLMPASSA